jgi:hypothetical protein
MPRTCKLLIVGNPSDICSEEVRNTIANDRFYSTYLHLLGVGTTVQDFQDQSVQFDEVNSVLNLIGPAYVLEGGFKYCSLKTMGELAKRCPNLIWIHSNRAGIDHVITQSIIANNQIMVTNGRGIFSQILAEYVFQACLYFTKKVPLLLQQQKEKNWARFELGELSGKTMGILGYGSIGKACAKVAKVFEMEVIALRKHPELSQNDPHVDKVNQFSSIHY